MIHKLDERERGPQPPQDPPLGRMDLGQGTGRLLPPRLVASSPKMQVDPVTLPLDLIDLVFAVVLAAASNASTSVSRGRCWSSASSSHIVIHSA
jgi:hypothetical protein